MLHTLGVVEKKGGKVWFKKNVKYDSKSNWGGFELHCALIIKQNKRNEYWQEGTYFKVKLKLVARNEIV